MKGDRAMNNYCIYIHTTPSGKRYIGITKQKPEDRWQNGKGYRSSSYFYRAINKYGWDNIEHEIIFSNLSHEEACRIERLLIAMFNSCDRRYGYNVSLGGDGGPLSEETKKKISKANKGRPGPKGEEHPMYGKHHSEESKKKMSEAAKNRPPVKDITKEKLSIASKSKWDDPEYYKRLKELLDKANREPERLRKISESSKRMWQSEEYRRRRKELYSGANNPSARAVMQYTIDYEYVKTWDTCKEAGDYLGKAYASICRCARGERLTAYGYRWFYVD